MITKCPNCGELLEYGGNPGELTECASCGNAFEATAAIISKRTKPLSSSSFSTRPIQIEQTSKIYKLFSVIFFLMIVVGIVAAIAESPVFGPSMLLIGLVGFLGTRFFAWWNHG